jgi:hypothetical protein
MKLKFQAFELEIEGNREDASLIGRSIGDQISSVISPGVNIVEGEFSRTQSESASPSAVLVDNSPKRRGARRGRPPGSNTGDANHTSAVEFRNDPTKYATPTQQWKTADKALWLLYVVKETSGVAELSTGQIVKTFNTHFRQAKTITGSNVSRDLGRLKVSTPSLVGEDTTKSPALWYLTEEGVRRVQALIADGRSQPAV